MTTAAAANHCPMVHQGGLPNECTMAGLAAIVAEYMIDSLAGRSQAIVAANAVSNDAGMIEECCGPGGARDVAGIALGVCHHVSQALADGHHIVMTARATAYGLGVIDQWNIGPGCICMTGVTAVRCGDVIWRHCGGINQTILAMTQDALGGCSLKLTIDMTVFTGDEQVRI